jgi:hypothetical protein
VFTYLKLEREGMVRVNACFFQLVHDGLPNTSS